MAFADPEKLPPGDQAPLPQENPQLVSPPATIKGQRPGKVAPHHNDDGVSRLVYTDRAIRCAGAKVIEKQQLVEVARMVSRVLGDQPVTQAAIQEQAHALTEAGKQAQAACKGVPQPVIDFVLRSK